MPCIELLVFDGEKGARDSVITKALVLLGNIYFWVIGMKFYCLMIVSIVIDIFIFLAISMFYKPVPGTHLFRVFQLIFLSPFVIISFLQLLKLALNINSGYVVTGFGPGFGMFKWHFNRNMFWFYVGVSSELAIWIMLGVSVLRFLLKAK